ncbi:hypothetical protein [Paenibacillus contaminans]|uniref:hypothetical protein n=1 Tax=Paenibacillus contaminans TaxID=450362 RepID=UPI0011BE5FCB|nr:hypothetical protein [Paenibacillus contaminans]
MDNIEVANVFGVKKEMVLSYIEREQVDQKFKRALKTDNHIVVYGASKQGKSTLRRKHVSMDEEVLIQCVPNHDIVSIYSSILRQSGVQMETSISEKVLSHDDSDSKAKIKAKIPLFGEVDAEFGGKEGESNERIVNYKSIEINIEIAQDIGEVLNGISFNKFIVLENFHYLDDEIQKRLAFDLRTFQDMGVRVIILGIWRERNRLNQFNGDLIDRIIEIPVEPWEDKDFDLVIDKGCKLLNISFSDSIKNNIKNYSFGNIGIVQELCKELCFAYGVLLKKPLHENFYDEKYLQKAIQIKVEDYTSRHERALESIADASRHYESGLFLPYYIVKIIVLSDVLELKSGIKRPILHNKIKEVHHEPDRVRAGDMTNLLHGLSKLQSKKSIIPPLFDYDRSDKRLKVIDSTLLFFLKFSDVNDVLEEIPNPVDDSAQAELF